MNRGGILLLMSMFCVSTLLPARQSGTAPSAKATDAAGSPSGGALATKLKEYRDEGQGSLEKEIARALSDSLVDPPEDPDLSICQILGKHPGGEISQLIALLPDPVHTHLGLTFDRGIEVIQQAFQDDGYVYLTAVMPWDAHTHPEADDIEKRLTADAYHAGREPLPGLLIFRRADAGPCDPNRVYLVWIVGESPTRGINVAQFRQAAAWIDPGPRGRLRILGPTFSGSLATLSQLLGQSCRQGHLAFSGTVSSASEIQQFNDRCPNTLISFQESDENLFDGFSRFVAGRGGNDSQIAILSEDETAYGALIDNKSFRSQKRKGLADPQSALELHFPREISQLRGAYQSDDSAVASLRSEREQPRFPLPLNLEVSGSDDDTVPPFSHRQTPLSQEAVLLGIVSKLRERDIRYVLLRSTDPVDTLFLSQYLAAAYPHARIVSLNADMLAGRGVDAAAQLHGTMALSSYPPASLEGASQAARIFPSSSETGTYNALRSLLQTAAIPRRRGDQRLVFHFRDANDQQCPLSTPSTCDTGTFGCLAQPAFLVALGHDEYWVTDELPGNERSALPLVRPIGHGRAPAPIRIPSGWRVLELITAALAIFFMVWVRYASIRSNYQAMAQLAPATADARQNLVILIGALLITLVGLTLWPAALSGLTLPLILLLLILAALVTVLKRFRNATKLGPDTQRSLNPPSVVRWSILPAHKNPLSELLDGKAAPAKHLHCHLIASHRRWPRAFISAWAVIPMGICLLLPPLRPSSALFSSNGQADLSLQRWLQLPSGLSPVLPLVFLAAAGLWWSYHIIAGCALTDARRPRVPVGIKNPRWAPLGETSGDPQDHGRAALHADLVDVLAPRPARWLHYLLFGAVGALIVVVLDWHGSLGIMTLEGRLLGHIILPGAIFICTVAIIGTCKKLAAVWVIARRFLVVLEASPLRDGFERLDGHSWTELWQLGDAFLIVFLRLGAKTREALVLAGNTVPRLKADRKEVFDLLEATRNMFQVAVTADCRECELAVVSRFGQYQAAVAKAAGEALNHLTERWDQAKEEWNNPRLKPSPESLQDRACERFVCLVYVNFIAVILWRIRTLTLAVCGMFIFFSLAIMSYPFQPRSTFGGLLLLLFLCVVGTVTVVLAQLHRDVTLSLLTNTEPGKLGADFWARTASFVALPILSLAISRFPQIGLFVGSWLQPALRALQK